MAKSKCQATGKTRYPKAVEAKNALIGLKTMGRHYDYILGKRVNRRVQKVEQCRYYFCHHCFGYHLTKREEVLTKHKINELQKERFKETDEVFFNEEQAAKWKADSLPFPEPPKTNDDEMV